MKSRQLTVQCEGGLHLRVAARVVKEVQKRQSTVHVQCQGCPRANACSILELLQLSAVRGSELEVTADGPDEEATLAALNEVFEGGSGI